MVSVNKEQKKDKKAREQENVYNKQTCLSRALVVTPAHREILYRAFAQKMNIRNFCAAHLRCVTSVWWATQTAPRAFCSRACEGCLKLRTTGRCVTPAARHTQSHAELPHFGQQVLHWCDVLDTYHENCENISFTATTTPHSQDIVVSYYVCNDFRVVVVG